MQLLQMCPSELEQARQNKAILMFGVGSIEYHGSQLPLGTDFCLGDGVIQAVEKRLPDKVVAAPSLAVSPTGFAVSGPQAGTVDIGVDAFMHHCADLLDSYERMGFHKIVILVHHQGGNIIPMLKTVLTKHTMYEKKAELGEGWWTDKRPSAAPLWSCFPLCWIPIISVVTAVREKRKAFWPSVPTWFIWRK